MLRAVALPKRLHGLARGLCGLVAAVLPIAALAAGPASFPKFEVQPCCQLCPKAADPASYDSGFLDSFSTLVQGRDGWLFRTDADLLMALGPTPEGLQRLGKFQRALAQRNVALVMVVQPPRGLMHADKLGDLPVAYDAESVQIRYANMLKSLRAQGIVVPELERLAQEGGQGVFFFRGDHHWTPEGSRRTAKIVAESIRKMRQYRSLKQQRFVTRRDGLLAKRGTLQKAAQLLCGYGSPDQYVPRYVTEAADGAGAADLLGDGSAPQVTLVGTSNSDAAYNFAGFLSEYLQVDVLNVAIAGGGFEGAMLGYLPSPEFRATPPRILIWELETYHDLSDARFYRQAMPLMGRDCGGGPPLLERKLSLTQGRKEVLFNGGGAVRSLRGRDHFLDLRFGDPTVHELRAVVWYTNGSKDTIRIERSERAANGGRFVLNLRDDAHWGDLVFMSLDIETPPPAEKAAPGVVPAATKPAPSAAMQLQARLCARDGSPRAAAVTASLGNLE